MILQTLREETRLHHQAIEQNRLLYQVLRPTLTRDVYVEVLARFYGFYKPLEEALLCGGARPRFSALLKNGLKTQLLEQDLTQMGFDADALRRITLCAQLPCSDRPSKCAGILYVTEGSTLGSQIIAAAVKKSIGIDARNGGAYFSGYGASTRARWIETCGLIEASAQGTESERSELVAAAADTFDKLNRWFKEV